MTEGEGRLAVTESAAGAISNKKNQKQCNRPETRAMNFLDPLAKLGVLHCGSEATLRRRQRLSRSCVRIGGDEWRRLWSVRARRCR